MFKSITDKQQECDLPIYGGTSSDASQFAPKGGSTDPSTVTATSAAGTPVTPTSPLFETTIVSSAELKQQKSTESCKWGYSDYLIQCSISYETVSCWLLTVAFARSSK